MSHCEAMVLIKGGSRPEGMYHACGKEPADLHHKVTRARGGKILDDAGETYHHLYLCREHHNVAHSEPAFDNGLLIMGYVTTHLDGKPLYQGPDSYLSEHYGPRTR
jgi:hypothetical protein